jgi:hypothetical protein
MYVCVCVCVCVSHGVCVPRYGAGWLGLGYAGAVSRWRVLCVSASERAHFECTYIRVHNTSASPKKEKGKRKQ